jgi:N-acetylmuramic acid 6-phosphate (MurNAc-6-P) etherase
MSVQELLANINQETKLFLMLLKSISQIETLVTQIVAKMKLGGRLFYIGWNFWTIRLWMRQNALLLLVFL